MSTRNQCEYKEPTCLYLIGTLEGGFQREGRPSKEETERKFFVSFLSLLKRIYILFFFHFSVHLENEKKIGAKNRRAPKAPNAYSILLHSATRSICLRIII